MSENDLEVKYVAEPTARVFHRDSELVRGIMGPVGSGKTVACCVEIFSRALEQKPFKGVRSSRWALIRNTYPELLSTTLKTWEEWVPPEICRVTRGTPVRGELKLDLEDGTRVEAEILFMALDQEEDAKKLKSLELTGAFINEASEIRKSVLDMLTSRIPRYPSKAKGGASWHGIVMDTNPPDDEHWWYKLAEVQRPDKYKFYRQPPALIRKEREGGEPYFVPNDGTHGVLKAENVDNHAIGFDYWMNMVAGKDPEWIKVFVLGEYGSIATGKPVYPEYSDAVHCAQKPLEVYKGLPLFMGWDFGLTPAVVFAQQSPRGQLRVLGELFTKDMGIERFSRDVVRPYVAERFGNMPFHSIGDPAGGARSQTDETTCFQVLASYGFHTESAPSNDFVMRREGVSWFLTKLTDGEPGFIMDPACKMLRGGFLGKYEYRRMRVGYGDRFTETPDKNDYSHTHDALQYLCSSLRSVSIAKSDHGFGGGAHRPIVQHASAGWD